MRVVQEILRFKLHNQREVSREKQQTILSFFISQCLSTLLFKMFVYPSPYLVVWSVNANLKMTFRRLQSLVNLLSMLKRTKRRIWVDFFLSKNGFRNLLRTSSNQLHHPWKIKRIFSSPFFNIISSKVHKKSKRQSDWKITLR